MSRFCTLQSFQLRILHYTQNQTATFNYSEENFSPGRSARSLFTTSVSCLLLTLFRSTFEGACLPACLHGLPGLPGLPTYVSLICTVYRYRVYHHPFEHEYVSIHHSLSPVINRWSCPNPPENTFCPLIWMIIIFSHACNSNCWPCPWFDLAHMHFCIYCI